MTRKEREEAIRCLSVHSSTNGSGLCTDEQHYKAKQMAIQALSQESCRKDCRLCKEFDECENGKKGHKNGTSIGYSIGECKDFEPQESEE